MTETSHEEARDPLFLKDLMRSCQAFVSPTKANFLWMMLGNGIYALCLWGVLIVLAKLGSPQVVGQFALASAITAPVIMITKMQLRGVQATDARREYWLSDYIAVRVMSLVAFWAVVAGILCLGNFSRPVILVTMILALAKSVEALSDVFYGFFQQQERMGFMAKSMIIKGLVSVTVLGLVFRLSSSLPLALAGMCVSWLVILAVYDLLRARRLLGAVEGAARAGLMASVIASFQERRALLVRMAALAFPLGIVMGIVSLDTNIPRYAIEKYLGTESLGIFAALAYTTVAISMFVQALGQAVSPRLARHFADQDMPAFYKLLGKMILLNCAIGLLAVLIVFVGGEKILTLIYRPEYGAHAGLFLVLMFAATLAGAASAFGYAMTATRQFALQVPLFVTVLVSTFAISFWLIPSLKLWGAAIAMIVSALIQIAGGALIVRRAEKEKSMNWETR